MGTTVDILTEDMEVPNGMKLGGTGLVGDVTVDNMGLAVDDPGDKISLEAIEFDEITDM